ncbi:MAG: FkbM family methyltransferase [Bacteroidetes bacterium]|nr:FkbM family methyltransferase [Bacteroidota bacterium]
MKHILKTFYNVLPFKREFYCALKAVWTPNESTFKHLHFTGTFNVKIDDSKKFKMKHYGYQIENEIFWVGLTNGWEKDSMKLWIKLCEGSEVVFDIGANTGVYSLIAKTISPKARVFAFEPVKRVFSKLEENIALNEFDITAVEKAVSNSDGTGVIYDIDSEHVYSVTVNKNLSSSETKVTETKISTIALNTFIKQNNIEKIDLIKIDVETHEPEVLEGLSEYLSKFKPTLLIEILNDDIGYKVNQLVKDNDYLFFNINEKGSIRQVDKITKSDYFNYLICSKEVAGKLKL